MEPKLPEAIYEINRDTPVYRQGKLLPQKIKTREIAVDRKALKNILYLAKRGLIK